MRCVDGLFVNWLSGSIQCSCFGSHKPLGRAPGNIEHQVAL